jgi:hypothetical protein
MVPMDQPAVALSMIGTFLQNKRYAAATSQNKLGVALDAPGAASERCERTASSGGIPAVPDADSGSAGSSLGLGFWPSSGGVQGKVQHVRRQRVGRRNDHSAAVVNPNPVVTAAQGGRQLLSDINELEASDVDGVVRNTTARSLQQQATPAFSLVLGHVTPLNGSALAHVKLVHQTHAPHLQHHHHSDHTAVRTALSGYQLAVAVQPGNLVVPVDVATLLSKHLTADVVVAGLQDGTEYSFSTVFIGQQGVTQPASKRVVTATPGCFNPAFIQCCGNGRCMASSTQATCKCDEGYTGTGCDVIAPHPQAGAAAPHVLDTAVTCPAHFHAHLALVHAWNTTTEALATTKETRQPNSAGTDVRASLNGTQQLKYCAVSLGGSGRTAHPSAALCRVSIQMQLQLPSSGSSSGIGWPSQSTVSKHYGTAVAVLLGADISAALARVVSGQDVSDIMHVMSGSVVRQPGDGVILGGPGVASGSIAHEQSGVVMLTVSLLGPAKRVDAVAGQLVEQLQQPTSILRTEGVAGRYLSHDIVVMSHKDADDHGVEGVLTTTGRQGTRGSGATRNSDGPASPKKDSRWWLYVMIAVVAGCGVVCGVAGMRTGPRASEAVRHLN